MLIQNAIDMKRDDDNMECPGNSFFILIDAAQYPRIWKILDIQYRHLPWLSLFENAGNDEAVKVGPVLIQIERDHETTLQSFLDQTKETHCLSWIVSPLTHVALRDHLHGLTNIETEDGSSWVMRYFDTRILPVWYHVLNDDQKRHVASSLVSWEYIDRFGKQQLIEGAGHKEAPPLNVFVLSQEQENTLFDAAYPDAIIQQIEASGSEKLQAIDPTVRYPFIAKQIQTAHSRFKIEAVPDVILYCTLALIDGDGFEDREPYAGMLRQVADEGISLGDALHRANSSRV